MTAKDEKLKSESFFSISYDVLELWRKNPKGADPASGPDRVKTNLICCSNRKVIHGQNLQCLKLSRNVTT